MSIRLVLILSLLSSIVHLSQGLDSKQILYYELEPYNDSLLISIQAELNLLPPDPKAEIIVDLRNESDQIIIVQGHTYPFYVLSNQSKIAVLNYPFKIDLENQINFSSVFLDVIKNIKIRNFIDPPKLGRLSSLTGYNNPYFQIMGGERFGWSIKEDIGISAGVGTEYSGPLETNFVELNFHILGIKAGFINSVDAMTELKKTNNHNNLFTSMAAQVGYVIPLGNFLEISYLTMLENLTENQIRRFHRSSFGTYRVKVLHDSYINWEFRYPFRLMGALRSKLYFAEFVNEYHIGLCTRESVLAGEVMDFRFDYMFGSDVRRPQLVAEVMVQRFFDSWAYSAFAVGPTAIFTTLESGNIGASSFFINFRVKLGANL